MSNLERWPCGCAKGYTPHGVGWADCIATDEDRARWEANACVDCGEPMGVETSTRNGQPCHIRCPRDYPGPVGDALRRLRDERVAARDFEFGPGKPQEGAPSRVAPEGEAGPAPRPGAFATRRFS